MQAHEGLPLWRWAQDLLAAYEAGRAEPQTEPQAPARGPQNEPQAPARGARAHERLTLAEIGMRLGLAARGRPFSVPWVSRALHAARDWPAPPRTERQRIEFARSFHGHARQPGAAAENLDVRIRRVLRRLRLAAVDALALGCRPQEIRDLIDAALCGAADVGDDAPALVGSVWAGEMT